MSKKREIKVDFVIDGKKGQMTINGLDTAVKKLERNTRTAADQFSNIGNAITGLSSAISIFKQFGSAIESTIEKYRVQEQAEKALSTALGKNADALIDYAGAMQKVTTHGDEEIIRAQSLIAAYTKDETQIKELTKATLDLADAKGMSLASAADLVGKTIGSSTNALSRYGVQVEGAVGSTERLNSLLAQINEKFGGQAIAKAQTETGKLTQAENLLGDQIERIGKVFAPVFAGMGTVVANATKTFMDFLLPVKSNLVKARESAIKAEDEFDQLAFTYLELKKQTKLTASEQQLYNDTIKQLNEKYPNYLKNVDLERGKYEDVKTALDKARQSLVDYYNLKLKQAALLDIDKKRIEGKSEELRLNEELRKKEKEIQDVQNSQMNKRNKEDRLFALTSDLNDLKDKIKQLQDERKLLIDERKRTVQALELMTKEVAPSPTGGSGKNNKGGSGKTSAEKAPPRPPLGIDLDFTDIILGEEEKREDQFLEDEIARFKREKELSEMRKKMQREELKNTTAMGWAAYDAQKSILTNMANVTRSVIQQWIAKGVAAAVSQELMAVPPPFNLIAAASVGVMTSALFEELVPKFEYGGMIDYGYSHAAGGAVVNAERGEYIVNKRATAENIELLEAINAGREIVIPENGNGFALLAAEIRNQTERLEAVERIISVAQLDEVYTSYLQQKNRAGV